MIEVHMCRTKGYHGPADDIYRNLGTNGMSTRTSMAVAPTRITLEEFLDLPEEERPLELVDGVVTPKVSPKGRHAMLQGELVERLNQSARHGKRARAFPELRATFGGASVVPDISVYRQDRIPRDASGLVSDDFLIPPDIAIEIASPEQRVTALVRRCLWYVANGVHLALLVDPDDLSVLAFRLDQQTVAWRDTDQIALQELLPEFSLAVRQLFDVLRPI
jgi:Uma2 family endonuclease